MKTFSKNAFCPSSPQLLAFQKGDFVSIENQFIRRHLITCDFCAAEVEFYAHFPQAEEKIESTEIPGPLLELAEALLGNRQKDFSVLDKLLRENEELSFGKF